MKAKAVRFGNGSVRYFGKADPTPATSKTTGNVTVTNEARPGHPACYEVTFMIDADFPHGRSNVFHWTVVVPEEGDQIPYREVEAKGAQLIAPMLRSVADLIEQEVARFDARKTVQKNDS